LVAGTRSKNPNVDFGVTTLSNGTMADCDWGNSAEQADNASFFPESRTSLIEEAAWHTNKFILNLLTQPCEIQANLMLFFFGDRAAKIIVRPVVQLGDSDCNGKLNSSAGTERDEAWIMRKNV
jgi:hypothetical protein